ncbi:membrane-spanning 4-domains subfamily A member 4A [Triplophysa rosa]|uniref:Membrane-spanning 4-domain protein n=1 Tax=Triplophysa rosa TaxID=992332 RepID=A0A9W8C4J1_TRIRA|nr:membrane-spanning 4-domains subfamily A member 4A [Triplophysa rosa]KAI7807147.1 membrane-spanning 4-domain protein [Triplophysa rosa]
MVSSMTTTASGVKVVTHIIPLDEKTESTDLKVSMVEPEMAKLPPITRMFLKGRPMMLGLMQVFIGAVMISLLAITMVINTLHADFVVTLGLPFIISGVVAITAHKRLSTTLIKATLAMSIICVLLAAAGIGYFSWELSFRPGNDDCSNVEYYWECSYMRMKYYGLLDGMRGLLLVLSCLEVCVCITLSVFSIRAIRQNEKDYDYTGSDCSLLKDGVDP